MLQGLESRPLVQIPFIMSPMSGGGPGSEDTEAHGLSFSRWGWAPHGGAALGGKERGQNLCQQRLHPLPSQGLPF